MRKKIVLVTAVKKLLSLLDYAYVVSMVWCVNRTAVGLWMVLRWDGGKVIKVIFLNLYLLQTKDSILSNHIFRFTTNT